MPQDKVNSLCAELYITGQKVKLYKQYIEELKALKNLYSKLIAKDIQNEKK